MPPGMNDYDVVIGATISDQTAPGAASVRGTANKLTDDIRRYGDRSAREFARNSRDVFTQTDQQVTRSASGMVRRLTQVFDTHNFLLRNMAFRAGSTTAAVAIGVAKLGLSYSKLGKDTEEASHRSKVALDDVRLAVSRLGTDPSAFPAALQAARNLSSAYEGMGKSGHAASIKAGNALEDAVHKRLVNLQGGLQRAQSNFEKLRVGATKDSELLSGKINEISASVRHLLGGAPVDAPFFKSFIKARTENEKYLLVLDKLGPKAAIAYAQHQNAIEKLSSSFVRLESRTSRSIKTQANRLTDAGTKVTNYKNEIASVEKALVGVAGGSGEAAVATGGFISAIGVGGVALGVFLAVALLVVAAVAALTFVIYKGATSAAKYGDEIYKLSLSTGLTVKTLSALSVVARETNTDVDSLAKTFTRTQIQVQRGLDKPFSEAGRALRTLRVNFQELRKANPDQQVFMLAKAFTELNNQNVRATVSQQLFSRDAERQAKMLEQVANGFDIAQKKAKKYGLELDESGAIKAHLMTVAVTDMKLAWEGLWVSLGIRILPQLTILMENFTEWILKSGGAFDFAGNMINYAVRGLRIWIEVIKEAQGFITYGPGGMLLSFANGRRGKDGNLIKDEHGGIKRGLDRAADIIDKQDAEQFKEYQKRIAELKKRGLQGDDQYAAGKGPSSKSPLDRLEEQVKRLRFEIKAIQDLGSKEFKLRFELEDLQKVKSGFETIFKLRNEMGLVLNQPVPTFRLFGTPEQQREDLGNIQSYVRQMERMKSIFEGVRKVSNEQGDALAELARVQQESLMPVTDAGTLSQIKYFTALRDRAKAERELTSDVLAESKLRKNSIEDEVGATLKAYNTLQRDLGRSQDTIRDQRAQDEMFVRIIRGDLETEQGIRDSVKERMGTVVTPVVPTELMTIAAHAATIDLNVASIAEKIGANVKHVSTTSINSPSSQTGYATTSLVMRNPDGSVRVVSREDLDQDIETIKGDTTDSSYLRKRIYDESRSRAGGERAAEVRKANQDIIDNSMRMEQALIDIDTDYLNRYKAQQLIRRAEARGTTVSIILLSNDLKNLENTNSEFYKRTWEEADKSRLENHKELKSEIISIQNDIANNGFDQADREKRAYFQSIRDIQEASNQARESIIYNQVQISDQTIYHAEIADAKVVEFLAHQRSITEVIADAKVGIIDTTFSAIDQGLDKALDKLGFAKDLVKDLLTGFFRLALSPFFQAMYGGGGGTSSGGGGGGIFGGIPGFPGMPGGTVSGGTPPFNGFNIANLIPGLGGGGTGSAPSPLATSSASSPSKWQEALAKMNGGVTGSNAGFGGLFENLVMGAAPIMPVLGASLGMNLGGSSRFGSIFGGIGGGMVGLVASQAIPSMLAGTFAGLTALGAATLGIGAALAIGAVILAKNAARRRDEKTRNQATIDTRSALLKILSDVQTDNLDGNSARAAIEELHARWIETGNALKDSKTRNHHMATWSHFQPIIDQIYAASDAQLERENIRGRMIPVFGGGGWSYENQLIKTRPGEGIQYPGSNIIHTIFGKDRGYDTEFMFVPKGTRIINRQEMTGATPMITGGTAGTMGSSSSSELPELHIDSMEISLDGDGLANIVIKSPNFKKAVIHSVKVGKKEKKIA